MSSLANLMAAHRAEAQAIERSAYVQGWRWGWVCGAVAGMALGSIAMWAALQLGRLLAA